MTMPAITPGTQIGQYEIVELLGRGGMGEVYRARDSQLQRDVAIKVLLSSVANDSERISRFSREAQLLAALNHPNIAGVHGLEHSGDLSALVMELVVGPTLADRIALGAMTLDEALPIAKQIAEAIEAAHEQGIIHRDLKPANIKLRDDGTVKVLDFGLAKAADSASSAAESPTLSLQGTAAGVILGTAAYMAPEQARGKNVDRRADIWAFGCVLFEMLTGQRAFQGVDVTDTIVALLTKEPDWNLLPASASRVRPLMSRCLTKDRKQRLQAIGEARYQIDQLLSGGSSQAAETASAATTPWRTILGVAGAATTVAVIATWALTRPQPTAPPLLSRFEIVPTPALAPPNGSDRDVGISPDGRYIVYRGGERGTQLILRPIDAVEGRVIRGATGRVPIFSADSKWIGFFDGLTLKKVSIAGGAALEIATTLTASRGASWGDDGRIVFAINEPGTGLFSVSASGGEPATLTTPNRDQGEINHWYPSVLPQGRGVLFTVTARQAATTARVAVLDLKTGKHKILVRGSQAEYVPGGLLYVADGTLHAVRFDLGKLELAGNPVPVIEGVSTRGGGAANYSVSLTGTLIYVPTDVQNPRTLVWVDRKGTETAIPLPPRLYEHPRLSPDGKHIALSIRDEGSDIYIIEVDQPSSPRRLTFDDAFDAGPVWTPDGKRIVFQSSRFGPQMNLFVQNADGTGAAERLTNSQHWVSPFFVALDGGSVLAFQNPPETNADVVRFPLGVTERPAPTAPGPPWSRPENIIQTPFSERNAVLSPDGNYIAYESNESGPYEVYVRPFPRVDDGKWQVSSGGGAAPLWAQDGRELFYLDLQNRLMSVALQIAGGRFNAGPPVRQLDTAYVQSPLSAGLRAYDVGPGAQRFLMLREHGVVDNSRMRLVAVVNWFEELKATLAVK
jgi:serine/threonine-protein kinase